MTALTPLTPRAREIVRAARELLETEGPDGLSMRLIAARLGVQAPSLYKHLADKQAITNAIVVEALDELTAAIGAAMDAAEEDPLWDGAMAQRDWALAHPHLYRLIMEQSIGEEPVLQEAGRRAGEPLRRVTGDDRLAFTTLWCFGHGVIDQELRGRIPPDVDVITLWRRGLDALRPAAAPAAD